MLRVCKGHMIRVSQEAKAVQRAPKKLAESNLVFTQFQMCKVAPLKILSLTHTRFKL